MRHAIVIGAGIGGLAAALGLGRGGWDVTVLERAPALREFGAGIQISPNGRRVLRALGVEGAFASASVPAGCVRLNDAITGRKVIEMDLAARHDTPFAYIHRAQMVRVLGEAAQAAGAQLRFEAPVTAVHPEAGAVELADQVLRADLIIGADGLHSVTRGALNVSSGAFFTGQVAWRAIIPSATPPGLVQVWMAPGGHVVSYPIGSNMQNLVMVEERREWTAEGWSHPGDPVDIRTRFQDVAPELMRQLAQVETCWLWGLFRHPVASVWVRGHAALLGDAAHPTLPFLAQGANLALEDVGVLMRCLGAYDVDHALSHYQSLRRPRAAKVVDMATKNAGNFHLGGATRLAAHSVLRALGHVSPQTMAGRYDWVYGYDPMADASWDTRK
jgi:salicylate hydroxylase